MQRNSAALTPTWILQETRFPLDGKAKVFLFQKSDSVIWTVKVVVSFGFIFFSSHSCYFSPSISLASSEECAKSSNTRTQIFDLPPMQKHYNYIFLIIPLILEFSILSYRYIASGNSTDEFPATLLIDEQDIRGCRKTGPRLVSILLAHTSMYNSAPLK